MEFLAESIGLLDIEGGAVVGTTAAALPPSDDHGVTAVGPSSKNAAAATGEADAYDVAASLSSFFFSSWRGSSAGGSVTAEARDSATGDGGANVAGATGARKERGTESSDRHGGNGVEEPSDAALIPTILSPPTTATAIAPSQSSSFFGANDGLLAKHVTQRIDARTGGDCFTGFVDALTGRLIRGTMIYRHTGDVYDGPFLTRYEDEGGDVMATSLRHGPSAACHYSNGYMFVGSFEYDHPKAGIWHGNGWTYEGELMVVEKGTGHYAFVALPSSLSTSSVIGVSQTLPDSVLFHGNGKFARGEMVYRGEFHYGLANGVGREEIVLEGDRVVYCGEFRDGLRHGIGTLVEDCYSDGEGEEEEKEDNRGERDACDCNCVVQEAAKLEDGGDCILCDSTEEAECGTTSSGDGPDYAAGGTTISQNMATGGAVLTIPGDDTCETATSTSYRSNVLITNAQTPTRITEMTNVVVARRGFKKCCHRHPPTPQKQTAKRKKQRYSSGVWCAGQHEIEDCRGTVEPESGVFKEEETVTAAGDCATGGGARGGDGAYNNNASMKDQYSDGAINGAGFVIPISSSLRSSLNRTTWDMLDEKWLGV